MGRGEEAMEVGVAEKELPVVGEKGRAFAGLPAGVAGFPHFQTLNISQSVKHLR